MKLTDLKQDQIVKLTNIKYNYSFTGKVDLSEYCKIFIRNGNSSYQLVGFEHIWDNIKIQ